MHPIRQIEAYFYGANDEMVAVFTRRYNDEDSDIDRSIHVMNVPWLPSIQDDWTFQKAWRYYQENSPLCRICIVGQNYRSIRTVDLTNDSAPF